MEKESLPQKSGSVLTCQLTLRERPLPVDHVFLLCPRDEFRSRRQSEIEHGALSLISKAAPFYFHKKNTKRRGKNLITIHLKSDAK